MKEKPVAIEDNMRNILFFTDLGQRQPDLFCGLYAFDILDLGHQVFRERRDRCQCYPAIVGNDLRVDVLIALEDRNARALIRSHRPFCEPAVFAACGQCLFAYLPSVLDLKRYAPPAEPTAFPALRRMTSSRYLTPLPLYGSGGLRPRSFAAVSPSN